MLYRLSPREEHEERTNFVGEKRSITARAGSKQESGAWDTIPFQRTELGYVPR